MIQNRSIEGAYDEAIEDAASRIHEASRPQRMIASNSTSSLSAISEGISSGSEENNGTVLSPPSKDSDSNSDEISALGGDSSTSNSSPDNSADEDDIESNIQFLEEKRLILQRVKISLEKEEAYIAFNAHDIANGREPSSHPSRSSSIWSEAKAIIEEYKGVGGGSRNEENEGASPEFIPSSIYGIESRRITPLQSSPDVCRSQLPASSSSLDVKAGNTLPTSKRPKIDLSMVQQVSSSEFAKDQSTQTDFTQIDGNDACISSSSLKHQNCVSPTTRCQQASEMQEATDSRNCISQAALKQILSVTNAVISEHRIHL